MTKETLTRDTVTIMFAGDSGDGIQLAGFEFSNTAAIFGNDLNTFPDFPAEIRAPQGTVSGVSGFKINFGSSQVFTPGDKNDVLVAMNAAALKKNLEYVKPNGLIIVNSAGFDARNLKLANYEKDATPIDNIKDQFHIIEIDITKLTRDALAQTSLGIKQRDRSRNMTVLGFIYWLYHRKIDHTVSFLQQKFAAKPEIADANITALKAGYNFGITTESQYQRFKVNPAPLPSGTYRNIMGNVGVSIGLISAAKKANLDLFFAGYPITPASDILHELSRQKHFGVKTFQAEDEIAAIAAAIGASFAGELGVTATSGPGMALKSEAIGLAAMLEIPLVIINVQRGGPSTGLPTKTEQADLMQALYGRNGEAPVVVLAPHSPKHTFEVAFEAVKIAVEHMTPVILLSDGYIANGAEPWRFPKAADLGEINPHWTDAEKGQYLPYARDKRGVRGWVKPGMEGFEHRVGGLEKEHLTGNVSYDPENHQIMTRERAEKIEKIAQTYPPISLDNGDESADVLILGWGSTYGAIKSAMMELLEEGHNIAHLHLTHLNPLPMDLGHMLKQFKKVIIPELNNGQLNGIIRNKFLIDAIPLYKIQGLPFLASEIKEKVYEVLNQD